MSSIPNELKIMHWNAQSVQQIQHDLFHCIHSHNIDITLLQETWLKPNVQLFHPDYTCHRLDRLDRSGGGIAIIVRKTIQHKLLPSIKTKIIESLGIEIATNATPIKLLSVYFPGTDLSRSALTQFKNDISLLTRLSGSFFICGDLNAKHRLWNCVRRNAVGKILYDTTETSNFVIQHPSSPTHFPSQRRCQPSTIDLTLTNRLHDMTQPETIHDYPPSDHAAVIFNIVNIQSHSRPTYNIYKYSRTNWHAYRNFLNSIVNVSSLDLSAVNRTSIDSMINQFSTHIEEAKRSAVPLAEPHKTHTIKFTDELLHLQRLRNNARRNWQRTRDPTYRRTCNELNHIINQKVNQLKNNNWSQQLSKLTTNSRQMWKIGKCLKNPIKYVPPFKINGESIITDQNKSNALADQFVKSHLLTANSTCITNNIAVQHSIDSINNTIGFDCDYFKPKELLSIIKSLKNYKAPGPDKLQNILIKKLPRKAIVMLNFIFNACLKTSYFPNEWKIANVIAIAKPIKDLTHPQNYRPISLLSALSKVFEKLILKRINAFIEQHNCIQDFQFGFRPQLSTTHQLARVTHEIKNALDLKQSTGVILFDGEKAFDTVWHEGLLHKLFSLNFPVYIVKIIQSFLCNRKFSVSIKNTQSETKSIPAGVPQGSCLSPTLYNLFISDLPTSPTCETALFADDLAIYHSSADPSDILNNLQRYTDRLAEYYTSWRLKINNTKTQAAFFTKRRASRFLPSRGITIDGSSIEWQKDVKYLGCTLDSTLTYSKHIHNTIDTLKKCTHIYYPFINRKSKLSKRNKIIIYKVVFLSIMTYACPVWYKCAKTHIRKLQIIQNKTLKLIENLPFDFSTRRLHAQTKISLLSETINARSAKFFESCSLADNTLVNEITN